MYHLSYRLSTNPWPQWADVMHGYEIELVFGLPMMGHSPNLNIYDDKDRQVSHRLVHYWTNFAKFGSVGLNILVCLQFLNYHWFSRFILLRHITGIQTDLLGQMATKIR